MPLTLEKIDIKELTDNVTISTEHIVSGTGIFDIIMNTLTAHITTQFELNRIRGEDYATVYLGSLQSALQASVQILLNRPVNEAQVNVLNRQRKGFDDDAKQKILKIMLECWAVYFATIAGTGQADENDIPQAIRTFTVDNLMKNILNDSDLGDENNGSIGFATAPLDKANITPDTRKV